MGSNPIGALRSVYLILSWSGCTFLQRCTFLPSECTFLPSENSAILCPCELVTFQRVSTEYMANLIKSIKVETCALDPLPASVLTKCLPTLLPVITASESFFRGGFYA